jgi:hypothetical protein
MRAPNRAAVEPEARVFAPFEPPGDEADGEGDVRLEGLELLWPLVVLVVFKAAFAEDAIMNIAMRRKRAKTKDLLNAILNRRFYGERRWKLGRWLLGQGTRV